MKTHQEIANRSLAMVREVVKRIDADPEHGGLEHALEVFEYQEPREESERLLQSTIAHRSFDRIVEI